MQPCAISVIKGDITTLDDRFPVDLAAKTTLEAMLAHDFAGRVTVCAYTDEDLEAYKALLPQ